jgi:hypothetical protein
MYAPQNVKSESFNHAFTLLTNIMMKVDMYDEACCLYNPTLCNNISWIKQPHTQSYYELNMRLQNST